MKGYTWATCPKVIRSEVKTLQTELQRLLSPYLLGTYLHGSLALGGFQPRRSDIDVIAVTRQKLDLESKRSCITLLLRLSRMPIPIDIRFLVQADLSPFQHPLPCDLHYNETWREIYQQDLRDGSWKDWQERSWRDPGLTISLATLHQSGICLSGKPVAEIFTPIPESTFQEAMIEEIRIARESQIQGPLSFVLNACRTSAYLHEGMILSKDAGGIWGLAHLPEQYHPLLQQALAFYRGEQPESLIGSVLLEKFAGWILQGITRANRTTHSAVRQLQDEGIMFEARAMEQWLDDGGPSDQAPDREGSSDDALDHFHAWRPKARAHAGKPAPPLTRRSRAMALALARALKR